MSAQITVTVVQAPEGLAELPVGTRIVSQRDFVYELEEIEPGRHDSGQRYWIEHGSLSPYYNPPASWFPVIVLPPPGERG